MIRKDVEWMAETLLHSKPAPKSGLDMLEQWKWTVEVFAARLTTINERFNRDKFKKACGL